MFLDIERENSETTHLKFNERHVSTICQIRDLEIQQPYGQNTIRVKIDFSL
jgi:hypothetical protein